MIRRSLLVLPFVLLACGAEQSIEPTYTSISEKIFVPTCATSACHSGGNPQGGLDLTREKGREQLLGAVQGDAWQGTPWEGFKRVAPGDLSKSALVASLEHPVDLPEIQKMPVGSKLPDEWTAAIKTWIQNGAKND